MAQKPDTRFMTDLDHAMYTSGVDVSSKKKEKMTTSEIVIQVVKVLIAAVYFIALIFGAKIFGAENRFYLSLNVFSGTADPISWVRVLSFVILILSLSKIVRSIIALMERSEALTRKSGVAIFELASNIIHYLAIIALIFLVMGALGVDTTALLAGLGIVTLIFGMGAQSIVQDLVAGFFIIVEKVYDVGDIIAVNGFRGMVKSIGLRTTQIEDVGGNIMNVRNSGIGDLINMTNLLSVANCEISIGDANKLVETEEILARELPKFKDRVPELVEGPFYLGVDRVEKGWGNFYYLSFVATCEEGSKYRVERALRRELVLLLDTSKDEDENNDK